MFVYAVNYSFLERKKIRLTEQNQLRKLQLVNP